MSRTGLSAADIAESFRDRCGDGSVELVYTPTQTWVLLDAADMLDENERLRELVRDYDKVLDAAVDVWGRIADALGYGRKYDALHDRMRELGVEV